jgi:hypothetical protein
VLACHFSSWCVARDLMKPLDLFDNNTKKAISWMKAFFASSHRQPTLPDPISSLFPVTSGDTLLYYLAVCTESSDSSGSVLNSRLSSHSMAVISTSNFPPHDSYQPIPPRATTSARQYQFLQSPQKQTIRVAQELVLSRYTGYLGFEVHSDEALFTQ